MSELSASGSGEGGSRTNPYQQYVDYFQDIAMKAANSNDGGLSAGVEDLLGIYRLKARTWDITNEISNDCWKEEEEPEASFPDLCDPYDDLYFGDYDQYDEEAL